MTTARPWTPEHPVDADLAAALVAAQFPAAAASPVRVGEGWDNDVWRFGDLAFRFPRRAVAVQLLDTEARVLTWLGPRVPAAVPVPTHLGRPSAAFPYPFFGHPLVPGRTGDRAALDDAGRAAQAPAIAGFLRVSHALDVGEAALHGVPSDVFRSNVPRTAALARTRLAGLAGTRWEGFLEAAEVLLADPPPAVRGPAVPLHGDLYARHLLFDDAGAFSGVIDWGDVCLGDRAIDLSIAFTFLPPAARPAFFAAYGEVDGATLARARVIGLARYGVALLSYAIDVGDAALEAEAGRALTNTLT
jgi:aminoglycoside phosphotransferase (APT) family kinase protein